MTAGHFAKMFALASVLAASGYGQGTLADYQRAQDIVAKGRDLVVNVPGAMNWIGSTSKVWYTRGVKGGTEFVMVDAAAGTKRLAFDHEKLAAAITAVAGQKYTALELPFAPPRQRPAGGRPAAGRQTAPLEFLENETAIAFGAGGSMYRCALATYECKKEGAIGAGGRGSRAPEALSPEGPGGDPVNGLAYEPPASQDGDEGIWPNRRRGCAPRPRAEQSASRRDERMEMGTQFAGRGEVEPAEICASFDGKWEAFVRDSNVYLRAVGKKEQTALTTDGSEGNYYTFETLAWSPDSKKLVAYRTRPGYDRQIHYIESSPADQIQPKHFTLGYQKPGDALDVAQPVLFDVESRKATEVESRLFPNAYSLSPPVWWKDGRGFTFEYNARGHQTYTVIEVERETGRTRPLIEEKSKTFIYYNRLGPGLSAGRRYRKDVGDGKEIIWASERDGWEHLYLYDGQTGQVKNQITKGGWLVRNVDYVDEEKRQIWFEAGGLVTAGEDPYFTHYCRINFDGSGLTRLTAANATHTVTFSKDRKYYVDLWQRVDLPPAAELRRTEDRALVMELERAEAGALMDAGFRYPEVFVAKGRDGKTDIWGTIVRPLAFDAKKKYPVVESIYAGPQGSFVPKTFSAVSGDQALAELGFIVVHIDGMGTSNRSKAFHDVAFQNLGDAGFADRILWHQAAAAKYPYYDITRVGVFGTSAGGQSALGALLFHPEFYKVAVTNSGCHDNRMDKIWWNEQWMGWPVGPQYAASSNVDHAAKLEGKVLIVIGEMDSNVDPASSLQVVDALVKAHKHFDMLYIPGQNHGVGSIAGDHYRDDYFVHHLLGVEPPDWNRVKLKTAEEKK